MRKSNAIIGGEGNGGVLLPDFHLGRDAPLALAMALCFLSSFPEGTSLAKAIETLPQYRIAKLKAPVPAKWDLVMKEVTKLYNKEPNKINTEDGIRVDTPEGWFHLRKSNTEPVYRVIGESGTTLEQSKAFCENVMSLVANLDKQIE